MSVQDELFPLPDPPPREVEARASDIKTWSRQFVNRWVFLKHQRDDALKELEELIAAATTPAA